MLCQRENSKQLKHLGEIKQTNFVKILSTGLQVHMPHPTSTYKTLKFKRLNYSVMRFEHVTHLRRVGG